MIYESKTVAYKVSEQVQKLNEVPSDGARLCTLLLCLK